MIAMQWCEARSSKCEERNEPPRRQDSVISHQSTLAGATQMRKHRRERENFGAHPLWRRVAGITFAIEETLSRKERRRGLRRLVHWLKEQTLTAEAQRRREGRRAEEEKGRGGKTAGFADERAGFEDAANCEIQEPGAKSQEPVSVTSSWNCATSHWARVKSGGVPLEALCQRLQISRARLTTLTKECCGLSAQELLDGFKIDAVRKGLMRRLREAARALWGFPGSYAITKIDYLRCKNHEAEIAGCGLRDEPRAPAARRQQVVCATPSEKRSKYFRIRPEDLFKEEREAERVRRTGELCAMLRGMSSGARRRSGGFALAASQAPQPVAPFDLEAFALECGFESAARLRRACLNVLGKSLKQIERTLAAEVVQFYLCAEEKQMREIACGPNSRRGEEENGRGGETAERVDALTACARELYWGREDKPTEPFLDEWSAYEWAARDWLKAMISAFG